MARNCSKEDVRALVEGTLDLEDSLTPAVIDHIESCSSCKKLRAKLESKEASFRRALESFGMEDSSRCPAPEALARFAEKGIEEGDPAVLEHLARCNLCRTSVVAARTVPTTKVPEETLAAARRRVALARTSSDEAPIPNRVPSGRTASARRGGRNTTRQAAVSEKRSSWGLVVAAAACFTAAFVFFAVVRDSSNTDETANTPRPPAPSLPAPPPVEKPAPKPVEVEKPAPPEEPIVAQAPTVTPPPVEEEPREPETPSPAPETPKPQVEQPAPPAPTPPTTTPAPTTPRTQPVAPSPRPEPAVLACKVDAVTGPIEIKKKAEPAWRRLLVSDLVQDGDGLRSKGEDGAVTFSNKARVSFDGDATGTVTIKPTGVCVQLESGSLEGESLAYDGLEIREANGFVTAWKGSKVRVEATEKGLRVCVDKGTVNAGNDLGKVTVHTGKEIVLVRDKKPTVPRSLNGPYRSPRR